MRLDRIDRLGGQIYARFWGSLLLIGVVAIGVPMLIGTISNRAWVGAGVTAFSTVAGLVLVRYLFSSKRRLSELD